MIQLVSSGRAYRAIPLWRRIENQLGKELGAIAETLSKDKDVDLDALLPETMDSLAYRLNLTLG